MALFRRRSPDPSADGARQRAAIEQFWQWWTSAGASETARAIAESDPGRMVAVLSKQVRAVGTGLAWELGPGTTSEHVLVVSCEGDPALRGVSRRWALAAPAADATWQYSDVRLPSPDPEGIVLQLGGSSLDVASVSVGARVVGNAVDVVLHHPAYSALTEAQQATATFLLLDAVLGEAAVESWLGSVGSSAVPPLDGIPLTGLTSVVDGLRAAGIDEDGQPRWTLLRGTAADGSEVLAMAQIPLRPIMAPHLDTHVLVTVPYSDRTDEGLPGPESLHQLRALEDHLGSRLGGSGRVLAQQSNQGLRLLHVYVDGTTPAAEQVRAAVVGWPDGVVRVDVQLDPAWQGVAHLR